MKTMRTGVAVVATLLAATSAFAALSKDDVKRLNESATLLSEIRSAPDDGIPQRIWNSAQCVVVIPSLKKAAFIIGGEFGSGVMSCRHAGKWGAPIFMEMAKGSAGFQIGAQSVDLVLIVRDQDGVDKLLRNKVTLGAEASVAGGPVGRDARAATDAQMKAEILSYSRTQGLFAGVNLSGGVVKPDEDDNRDLYGAKAPRDIVMDGTVEPPAATEAFMAQLKRTAAAGSRD